MTAGPCWGTRTPPILWPEWGPSNAQAPPGEHSQLYPRTSRCSLKITHTVCKNILILKILNPRSRPIEETARTDLRQAKVSKQKSPRKSFEICCFWGVWACACVHTNSIRRPPRSNEGLSREHVRAVPTLWKGYHEVSICILHWV